MFNVSMLGMNGRFMQIYAAVFHSVEALKITLNLIVLLPDSCE